MPVTLPMSVVRVEAKSGMAAIGVQTGVTAACVPAVSVPSPSVVPSTCSVASQTPRLAPAAIAEEAHVNSTEMSMNWSSEVPFANGVTDDRTLLPFGSEFRSAALKAGLNAMPENRFPPVHAVRFTIR